MKPWPLTGHVWVVDTKHLLALLAALNLALPAAASAQPELAPSYKLSWSRSDQAQTCPDAGELTQAIADKLGRDPFDAESPRTLSVEFTKEGSTWRSTIRAERAAGTAAGMQGFTSEGPDCDEVFSATVAALAVMLGASEEPSEQPEPPEPEPEAVPPATTAEPAADVPEPRPKRRPAPPARARRHRRPPPAKPKPQPSLHSFIGLELAQDMPYVTDESAVCGPAGSSNGNYECYYASGEPYTGVPLEGEGNEVGAGVGVGTRRLLGTYQYLFTSHVAGEVRAGIAVDNVAHEASWTHLELGARYWLGDDFSSSRAFVGASVGLASFDFTVPVTVVQNPDVPSTEQMPPPGETQTLDATRRYGMGFVSFSVGGLIKLGSDHGFLLRASAIETFPSTGFVVQPSAGYVWGW